MNLIDLTEWNGHGAGYTYEWNRSNRKVTCEYLPHKQSLKIALYEHNELISKQTEPLHMNAKPSVFNMRLAAQRVINGEIVAGT